MYQIIHRWVENTNEADVPEPSEEQSAKPDWGDLDLEEIPGPRNLENQFEDE